MDVIFEHIFSQYYTNMDFPVCIQITVKKFNKLYHITCIDMVSSQCVSWDIFPMTLLSGSLVTIVGLIRFPPSEHTKMA